MTPKPDATSPANPLLDLWTHLFPGGTDILRLGPERFIAGMREREGACRKYAWAIPTGQALDAIAAHGPVVEIGAGTGYWASLLAARGVDVVAYDIDPPRGGLEANHWHKGQTLWFPVQVGGPEMAAAHSDRTLLLCWPPYDSAMAADCLDAYTGSRVVYVGEGASGCTGDDRFHQLLDEHFTEEASIGLPQWPGMHDRLEIYRRLAVVR